MQLMDKLAVLADAAKYDASCASSGTTHRNFIEGLFLSSRIINNEDNTLEQVTLVAIA